MPLYNCELCNYNTHILTHYNKHLNTKKHQLNIEELEGNNKEDDIIPFNMENVSTNEHKVSTNEHNSENGVSTNEHKVSTKMSTNEHKMSTNAHKKKSYKRMKCDSCGKTFATKPILFRHQTKYCKGKMKQETEENNKLLFDQVKKIEEHYENIINEKNKIIETLKNQDPQSITNNTNNIINNIYTMKPITFLNSHCNNNPSLEKLIEYIKESDIPDNQLFNIKMGCLLNKKHIIGHQVDEILKEKNKEFIKNKNIDQNACDNVLFTNDGSCRRFIAKNEKDWSFFTNDRLLEDATTFLVNEANKKYKTGYLFNKKDRRSINKTIKTINDYNSQKSIILKSLNTSIAIVDNEEGKEAECIEDKINEKSSKKSGSKESGSEESGSKESESEKSGEDSGEDSGEEYEYIEKYIEDCTDEEYIDYLNSIISNYNTP